MRPRQQKDQKWSASLSRRDEGSQFRGRSPSFRGSDRNYRGRNSRDRHKRVENKDSKNRVKIVLTDEDEMGYPDLNIGRSLAATESSSFSNLSMFS